LLVGLAEPAVGVEQIGVELEGRVERVNRPLQIVLGQENNTLQERRTGTLWVTLLKLANQPEGVV
jgi:hypothetical protein